MSVLSTQWLLKLLETFSAIAVAFFLSLAAWLAGPSIEAKYFPVATKLAAVRLTSHPEGTKLESAIFQKLRDCELRGITWFHKLGDGSVERVFLKTELEDDEDIALYTRPVGYNVIKGPWIISLPLSEVVYHSFARIHHRCHGFWLTVSEFYP